MNHQQEITSENDTDSPLTPAEIKQTAKNATENLIPQKSKQKYNKAYKQFMDWRAEKKIKSFSENILLAYLSELSHNHKPTTLWATYSMLKTTLNINNNININNYQKLVPFLKKQSRGFQPKKSKVLTPEEINEFLNKASDQQYLDTKVAMIFGLCGACRREELTQITINDIEDKGSILLVKIPKTKNYKPRSFVISDENFYNFYKKYTALRPKNIQTSRFFLNYYNGQCTKQPIGINKFGRMPQTIASYLKLPQPELYTGHTFRRTSATLLVDSGADLITLKRHGGWKSNAVAEGYVEDSLNNKKEICNQITKSLTNKPSSEISTSKNVHENPSTSKNYAQKHTETIKINTSNKENRHIKQNIKYT
ncbi:uncharacterized protein [Temnothorax nylanderi]|uniref:uncharacterized protein n=1 Tax=Temnothorax nylanderi TaxID=102681 RepID=UPI003A8636EA